MRPLGGAVVELLTDLPRAGRLGESARERVTERLLGNRHLL